MLPSTDKPKILEPYYTNDDIEFLHNIVVQAENVLPSLPKRERLPTNALFSAYYELLPTIGVDADHDSRYARVLFKIGGLRGEGTLYEKFTTVLARLGIQIEFDSPGEELYNDQIDRGRSSTHGSEKADRTDYVEFERNGNGSRGRPRANSESSIWIGHESAYCKNGRTMSLSPEAKLDTEPFDPRREKSLRQAFEDRAGGQSEQIKERPGLVQIKGHTSQRHRSKSESRHDQLQTRPESQHDIPWLPKPTSSARAESVSALSSDGFTDARSATTQSSEANDGIASHFLNLVPKRQSVPVLNPSTTLMELKSTLAYENHLKQLRRPVLRTWHSKAKDQRERNEGLLERAQEHDKDHLLRDTLDIWCHRVLEHQNAQKTLRFFRVQEKRVEISRDRGLLSGAFQKWSRKAATKVAHNNEARNQITKSRYFNRWRNATNSDEIEVEQRVLGKFYGLWKRKSGKITSDNETAISLYEGNLVKRVLKDWLYGHMEKVIRCNREANTKEQILSMWLDRVRALKQNQVLACEKNNIGLVQTSLTVWREKAHASLQASVQAQEFFIRNHGRSLLQQNLTVWCHRTRLEKEAEAKDREWCLKETLTALRMGLLRRRTNKRLAQRALHTWQLAARLQVAKRVLDERRKLQVLQVMQAKRNRELQVEFDMETRAQDFRKQILQEVALKIWRQRLETEQEREMAALNHHASHIAFNALERWFKKHEDVQAMNRQADQVIYFFRGHKSLQRWNEATKASRIERGRAAYAQVRRTVKTRMARDVIARWREKTQQIRQNQGRAKEFSHNKSVVFSMEAFDKWRARTEDIGHMSVQAQTKYNNSLAKKPLQMWRAQATANIGSRKKLLSTQLSRWRLRLGEHEQNEARAREFLDNHTAVLCSRYLNKWSNDAFQIRIQVRTEERVQELKAEEYLDRCNKKHFRKFFKYWRIRMLDKRGIDTNQLRQVSRIYFTPASSRSALGATARNEEWSAFEEGFDVQDLNRQLGITGVSTPTPSRRSNINQSLVKTPAVATPLRLSAINQSLAKVSTTPGTPLATPLERRLRKGLFSATPWTQPPARSGLGRSVFTQGFADITEVSREDGDEGLEE